MHLRNYRTVKLIRPFVIRSGLLRRGRTADPALFLAQEPDAAKEDAMLQPAIGQELR